MYSAGRGKHHNRQQEFYQAGVELLPQGWLADAEVLLLLAGV